MKKLFLLFFLICIAWPLQAAQPVRIGFLGPLTGPYENEGVQAREVLLLLASDLNDRGGLLGKKVEIIFENEGDNPQAAAAAAKKLLEQKAVAVIGPQTSDAAKAVQEIFHAAGILQISYGATAVSLTQKGFPYFFRTCPRDDEQARAFVRILRKLNFKKVALLHDQSLYGKGLAEA
ncbi:MAG: branched-chain amino acid ABC transporter substrate-binding protein, partial [Smithellaceae bacterium]|nr:branched-chain amino acid ABC transporter substrate-binding protein [Smithellaceae bacterium]